MRRTEICYTCRHWLGAGVRQRGPKGQCRRFPPVITDRAPSGSFPVTDSSDWCGEWGRMEGPPDRDREQDAQPRQAQPAAPTLYDEL